jgi:hypothetical protein
LERLLDPLDPIFPLPGMWHAIFSFHIGLALQIAPERTDGFEKIEAKMVKQL